MALLILLLSGLIGAVQDPFADAVRLSDLDQKPRIVEKRVPSSAVAAAAPRPTFQLEFVIERDGSVHYIRPAGSGGTVLEFNAIRELLRRWEFTPGQRAGLAVRTLAVLTVSFTSRPARGGTTASQSFAPAWAVDGVEDDFGQGAGRFGDPGIVWPAVKKEVLPAYPRDLVSAGIDGRVELEVLIEPSGRVSRARVTSSSSDRFERNALECARQWVFEPRRAGAIPVVATVILEFLAR